MRYGADETRNFAKELELRAKKNNYSRRRVQNVKMHGMGSLVTTSSFETMRPFSMNGLLGGLGSDYVGLGSMTFKGWL